MDNASNNDTMMEYISADLEADGIDYSPHKIGFDITDILST